MLTVHQCDNCDQYFDEDQLDPIRDLMQRVSPGELMPSGECPNPDCGALCHPASLALKDALTLLFERLDGSHLATAIPVLTPSTSDTQQAAPLVSQALRWVDQTKDELA